jgi:hypothetical protein
MARHVRLREFLVGVEGLALLRGLFSGSDESAHRRIDEVRRTYLDVPGALAWDLAKDE